MARIIVMTDHTERPDLPVLLDEHVCSAHLSDEHAASQLIERLGWAVTDAEDAEREQSDRPRPVHSYASPLERVAAHEPAR
jgi:hypothetical protein